MRPRPPVVRESQLRRACLVSCVECTPKLQGRPRTQSASGKVRSAPLPPPVPPHPRSCVRGDGSRPRGAPTTSSYQVPGAPPHPASATRCAPRRGPATSGNDRPPRGPRALLPHPGGPLPPACPAQLSPCPLPHRRARIARVLGLPGLSGRPTARAQACPWNGHRGGPSRVPLPVVAGRRLPVTVHAGSGDGPRTDAVHPALRSASERG